MIDREKKLCVDCEERPKYGERSRCYACHCDANPDWAAKTRERARKSKREKYRTNPEWVAKQRERNRRTARKRYEYDFEYRQRLRMSSYLSKCRKLGRLNNE